MIQAFFDAFQVEPIWLGASLFITLLVLTFFVVAVVRSGRSRVWFYAAALLIAVSFACFLFFSRSFFDLLILLSVDWNLIYVVNSMDSSSFFTAVFFHALAFVSMSVFVLLLCSLLSVLTFRWQRLFHFWKRFFGLLWFVLFVSVLLLLLEWLWIAIHGVLSDVQLSFFFITFSFLFLHQLSLQFLDNAVFRSPKELLEFAFGLGLALLLGKYAVDWYVFLQASGGDASFFFFEKIFSLLLVMVLLGYASLFMLKGVFVAPRYLEEAHQQRKRSLWAVLFLSRVSYRIQQAILGFSLAALVGTFMFSLLFREQYLILIPVFFLSYFLLFYLLDQQEDQISTGFLVAKRSDLIFGKEGAQRRRKQVLEGLELSD